MINAGKIPAARSVRSNVDLTYARMRKAALERFLAMGFSAASALLWSTMYANSFVQRHNAKKGN